MGRGEPFETKKGGNECRLMKMPPPRSGQTKARARRPFKQATRNLHHQSRNANSEVFGVMTAIFFGLVRTVTRSSMCGSGPANLLQGGTHESLRAGNGP